MKTKLSLRFLPVLAAWLASWSAGWAQTPPIIRDNSFGLGVKHYLGTAGSTILIPQADGRTLGNNLFHSFSRFNIPAGATADFQGAGVQNILSRVTGGEVSDIQGTLKSSIPGANFYLMNPAGVVFEPGGIDLRVEVEEAGELRFEAGDVGVEQFLG